MAGIKEKKAEISDITEQQAMVAVPKFERLLKEIENFDVSTITSSSDASAEALHGRVDTALLELFGGTTKQYFNFQVSNFNIPLFTGRSSRFPLTPERIREGYKNGFDAASVQVRSLIAYLTDKIFIPI
jgi:hypothetical protein